MNRTHPCRQNFIKPETAVFEFLATPAWAWIVTAGFLHEADSILKRMSGNEAGCVTSRTS
jgi:hypothetical protein